MVSGLSPALCTGWPRGLSPLVSPSIGGTFLPAPVTPLLPGPAAPVRGRDRASPFPRFLRSTIYLLECEGCPHVCWEHNSPLELVPPGTVIPSFTRSLVGPRSRHTMIGPSRSGKISSIPRHPWLLTRSRALRAMRPRRVQVDSFVAEYSKISWGRRSADWSPYSAQSPHSVRSPDS